MDFQPLSRRNLLAGAVGLAGAGLLGGCDLGAPRLDQPVPSAGGSGSAAARLDFGQDFRFGAATSAYQIEGAAHKARRGESIWDTFCARKGTIDDGSSGEVACDHYHLWRDDLDLMQNLGLGAYRFSISWPRVLPHGRGALNPRGMTFYQELIDGLNERGIKPLATLYHWDLPQVLQDRGGWQNRDCASWFAEYAATMFDKLDGVAEWVTINEAKVIAQQGYQLGWMAPGKTDSYAAGQVVHHLNLAHGRAVQAFRASGQKGKIGPCVVLTPCYPADGSAGAQVRTKLADVAENTLYLDPIFKGRYPTETGGLDPDLVRGLKAAQKPGDLKVISAPVDFLGVNYYSPMVLDGGGHAVEKYPLSSSGWQQIYPDGLREAVTRVWRDYKVEMRITENGVPDADGDVPPDDASRIDFLRDHLTALHAAIDDGVKVTAYYAWSLLDNFEWARGYTQKWGLVHVAFDDPKLTRTPKNSARWYSEVARTHTVRTG